jgi:hypothetical protein
MRIILAGLMGCIITIVCGLAAMSGIGARTPAFAPVTYVSSAGQPVAQAPRLVDERDQVAQAFNPEDKRPSDASVGERAQEFSTSQTTSIAIRSAPTVTVYAKKLPAKKKSATKATRIVQKPVVVDQPKDAEPHVSWTKASARKPTKQSTVKDVVKSVVAADPPKRKDDPNIEDLATAREWRRNVLDKWRNEASDPARNSDDRRDRVSTTVTLEGAEPADKVDKADPPQKKKKKRHRFLFIRW